MAEATVEAVVLRLQDYREADRLVWLLTAARGRLSAVARGARKSRKRFGGDLDLFQLARVRLGSGRGTLHPLLECRAVAAWPRLRADVARFAAASLVAELATTLSREEAADEAFFAAIVAGLAALDDAALPVTPAAVAALLVRLLTTAGFVVDLAVCGTCGRPFAEPGAPDAAWLEPGRRLSCGHCAPAPPGGAARRLPTADLAALAAWQRAPVAAALRVPAGPDAVAAARDLVREVVGRPLKSEAFLWEIVR